MYCDIQESKKDGKGKLERAREREKEREREREKQILHNNDCIVEYNSKLCLKTAQMYAKVHVHHVYTVFTLPCSTLRFFSLLKDKLSGKKVWYLSARRC